MNSTTLLDLIVTGQSQKEVTANALFNAASPAMLFGLRSSIGLTWKIYGGVFNLLTIANISLTLNDAATNYVEADALSGAVTSNTAGFTAGRIQLYSVVTAGGLATSWTDFRQSIVAPGVSPSATNIFTKNQSVAPVAENAATITPDASASNNFKITLGQDTTIANPTNLTDGMILNFRILQDATGGRLLTLGSKFKWPGGTVPTWVTTANAVSLISTYYDSTLDILLCNASLDVK